MAIKLTAEMQLILMLGGGEVDYILEKSKWKYTF